jgi:phosphopantothenoylcysteine synthetase/decarboxylase
MKVLITCGPAYEPVDEVRRLTNFSTGRLGIALANDFTRRGWRVTCLKGEQATCCDPIEAAVVDRFTTNDDLAAKLEALSKSEPFDVVLHAAALGDFRVARIEDSQGRTLSSPKLDSRSGEVRLVLAPATKVLPKLRNWFPHARIVGWKYELDDTREAAIEKARRQLDACATDGCVLNGRAYGIGFAICTRDGGVIPCASVSALAASLAEWLQRVPVYAR